MSLYLFLQSQIPVQPSPIYLGPVGTTIAVLFIVVLVFFSLRQRGWKSAAEAAKSAITSATDEVNFHRSMIERLREEKATITREKEALASENTRLKTQQDIKPVVDAITGWIVEGRTRFDQATLELKHVRDAQDKGIRELFSEVASARSVSEEAFRTYTTSFVSHVEEDRVATIKILNMFSVIENRLNEVAVKIGQPQWKTTLAGDHVQTSELVPPPSTKQASGTHKRS